MCFHACLISKSVGKLFPHPVGAFCTLPEPPKCYIGQTIYTVSVADVCIVYFAVLNTIIGVFCSSAIESTKMNQELATLEIEEKKQGIGNSLRELFGEIDRDGDGRIRFTSRQTLVRPSRYLTRLHAWLPKCYAKQFKEPGKGKSR